MPILIVEDNAVSAKLVEHLLQKAGYKTIVVKNGKEALASLPTIKNVQLIITDFMMPEMDGLEFIAKLRGLPSFRDIPIIILSARCDATTVKAARNLDCDSFLVKPVEKNQLLERVEQVLRDQPIVLREKAYIMNTLQIGEEEYDDLLATLAIQVRTAMPLIALEQSESNEPVSAQVRQLLNELEESASLLGADKFFMLYARLVETDSLTCAQIPAILTALQGMETALAAHIELPTQENLSPEVSPPNASAA